MGRCCRTRASGRVVGSRCRSLDNQKGCLWRVATPLGPELTNQVGRRYRHEQPAWPSGKPTIPPIPLETIPEQAALARGRLLVLPRIARVPYKASSHVLQSELSIGILVCPELADGDDVLGSRMAPSGSRTTRRVLKPRVATAPLRVAERSSQNSCWRMKRNGVSQVLRNVRSIVRRHIKHPVMIDQAETNAVAPAEAPEQILIDPFIGEKIHYRFEVQTERLDGDQMTKSLDAPSSSAE